MVYVWIGKTDAPETVHINVEFDIAFSQWYLSWPFKKLILLSYIEKDGVFVYDVVESFKPWWFWGCKKHILKNQKIDKDTIYRINVGYRK